MADVKFPNVHVKNFGEDGNAFALIGQCQRAARGAGVSAEDIAAFRKEAMSGDYDHVIQTCMSYFNCE